MLRFVLPAAALAVLGAAAPVAGEGPVCARREVIVERLETKYGETRRGVGLQQNRGLVEVFASAATGSWTILITLPTGMTCLMAAGEAWEELEIGVAAAPGDRT